MNLESASLLAAVGRMNVLLGFVENSVVAVGFDADSDVRVVRVRIVTN